jgi:hypothetical protein
LKKNKEDGSFSHYEYHISGVNEFREHWWTNLYFNIPVPLKFSNVSTSYKSLNRPRRDRDDPIPKVYFEVANLWTYNPCQKEQVSDPIGVPIHSHCWDMVERSIGPCRTSHELERLVNVLYKRWTRELFFGCSNCIKVRKNCKIFDPFLPNRKYDTTCHPEALITLTNPIDGKVIHKLLVGSIKKPFREGKQHTLRSGRFYQYQQPMRISGNIPPEIVYNILDHIRSTDTLPALMVLGWQAPDSYWQNRIPRDIIFDLDGELSQLKLPADIDWPFLCLKAEELLETSPSLLNRQRILRIVGSVKSLVRKELDKDFS